MRILIVSLLALLPTAILAAGLMPTRTIPSRSIVGPGDFVHDAKVTIDPGLTAEDTIGMEARVTLYPGRPLRHGDLGPAAAVERNQIVEIHFRRGALSIRTEGRSLERAPIGSIIRVMNLSSRSIITGRVSAAGTIEVGQ